MELKVWVEGIQRVVCGVNEKTTCQDVVYALAHATGKTGRFTLIERWRNSERLLAPGEQPLKVLLKWGDHSNDVQFILQWSPLDSSGSSTKATTPVKSGQIGNTSGGGGESLSESSSQFKGGTTSTNTSYSPYGSSRSTTQQQPQSTNHHISQQNGILSSSSTSSTSSSSKKLPYSPSAYPPNQLPPNQRPSPTLGQLTNSSGNNPNNFSKQFSHLNGNSPTGRLPPTNEASSGIMKGAPQRLIHNDAIKNFSASSPSSSPITNSNSGKVNSNSPGVSSLQQQQGALGKMKELSAPPPYREPPNPASYQGKVSPSVSSPSSINSQTMKGLPPYREPPPPTMLQQQQPSPSQQQYSISSTQYSLRHSGNSGVGGSPVRGGSLSNSAQVSGVSQSFFGSSANSSSSSLMNNGGNNNSGSNSVSVSGVPSSKDSPRHGHHSQAMTSSSSHHDAFPSAFGSSNASDKSENSFWIAKDHQLINGDSSSSQNGSTNKVSSSTNSIENPNTHYKDLVRLVNTQREKLTSQQAELTQYDAEIMFWEGKAKEQQRNMEFITKEISRLELISSQNENQVLSLSHLEEESECIRQESETLKTELNSLRGDLGKCEGELDKCRNRIRRVVDDLHSTQAAVNQRQDEWLQRESVTLSEVDRLTQELELARRETDAVSDLSGSLEKEFQNLDSSLAEKKKQMEQLVSAMKEANLQSLIINPPDETVDGGAHQRSGSTRRMIGSPRQLENAAPTSKNPHGVWV